MNFTKTHINIIILEALLIIAGITAILLKEITANMNVSILPEIRTDLPSVAQPGMALPEQSKISAIADEKQKQREIKKTKEITIEISDEPPKPRLREALKEREEKPKEVTIEFE